MSYLLNCWYVAALSDELGGNPLGRIYLDTKVVLFRDDAGVAHALSDRCPHRFVPLSAGRVVGGALECPYHGLRFDGTGACAHNPQGEIPRQAAVRSYPLIEKHSLLWIWMGDAAAADEQLVPDFSCNDRDENYFAGKYVHLAVNYQNAADNILDLSHVDFVHRDSLGRAVQNPDRKEAAVRRDGDYIWSDYHIFGAKPETADMDMPASVDPGVTGSYDFWLDVRWSAPACMLLHTGQVPSGTDWKNDERRWRHTHIFTPETETTSHYWFGVTHAKSRGAEYATRAQQEAEFLYGPFSTEDGPILALQQQAMGSDRFWDLRPLILSGDAGAVRARRTLDKMIRDEGVGDIRSEGHAARVPADDPKLSR